MSNLRTRRFKFFAFLTIVSLWPSTTFALCEGARGSNDAPPFHFVISKPEQVREKDVSVEESGGEAVVWSRLSAGTPVERRGSKESQRSEIRETARSSRVTKTSSWICYSVQFRVASDTSLPANNDRRAKLAIAQFHHEGTLSGDAPPPAILFELSPNGALEMIFSDELGAEEVVLLPGSAEVFDHWWELKIAARWSKNDRGRIAVWIGPADGDMDLKFFGRGANTVTGHVYLKLGAYRSFIERDPRFARSQVIVRYRDILRNGSRAVFTWN